MTGVCNFATLLLPLHKRNTSKKRFRDSELQRLCEDSKQMWSEWVDAGCPTTGDLYIVKNSLKTAVRQRINTLEAIKERKKIQQRDIVKKIVILSVFQNTSPLHYA